MIKKRWTKEEIEYLKLNYPIKRVKELILNRPISSIYTMAKKLKLKSPNRPCTKEMAIKIGLANKNKKRTIEVKKKMSEERKGERHPLFGKHHSEETKRKISITKLGKPSPLKGKKIPQRSGEKHHNWRGGITSITTQIKLSSKYKEWRQQCLLRNNFTCQDCSQIGGDLEVHHIKSFKILLEEVKIYLPLLNLYDGAMIYSPLWNIDNGKTLCIKCHKNTRTEVYSD